MKEDATFKVGKFTVHVDYYEGYGSEYCNTIHVSATVKGKDYWSALSELNYQSNEDGSRWLSVARDEDYEDDDPIVKMTAAQWKRVDQWLTAEEHY